MVRCSKCNWFNPVGVECCEKCGAPLTFDVFISYSRKDYVDDGIVIPGNILAKIKDAFKTNGISYWFDEEGIYSGDEFASVLTRAIRNSRIFLFVSSVNSNQSKWTSNEISTALELGKPIIPFRLDDSPYNDSVMMKIISYDYIECKDKEKAIDKLLRAVKHHLPIIQGLSRNHWRNIAVPEGAKQTVIRFDVNGEWQEHVFTPDNEKTCPNCGFHIRNCNSVCPICGEELPTAENPTCAFPNTQVWDKDHNKYSSCDDAPVGIEYCDPDSIAPLPKNPTWTNRIKSFFIWKKGITYEPFSKKEVNDEKTVYSSVFAPSEVKRNSQMLVQFFLHLFKESEMVKALARESQKNAERRDYIPLQCKLNLGDKVSVRLKIFGEKLLMSDKRNVVWKGSFTKCSFNYHVPNDIDVDELSCMALLMVNGLPVGEMRFVTSIVESPKKLNTNIFVHKYNKVFISYAHQDESKVKFLAEGFKVMNADYFFDRHYLKTGDVFPQKIKDYINSADLFILCWSENAAKSEYVEKERAQALERAFPKVKPPRAARLSIYPVSIEPRAELPGDMKHHYHFGEI